MYWGFREASDWLGVGQLSRLGLRFIRVCEGVVLVVFRIKVIELDALLSLFDLLGSRLAVRLTFEHVNGIEFCSRRIGARATLR